METVYITTIRGVSEKYPEVSEKYPEYLHAYTAVLFFVIRQVKFSIFEIAKNRREQCRDC